MRRGMSTGSCMPWRLDDAGSASRTRRLRVENGAEKAGKGRRARFGRCGVSRRSLRTPRFCRPFMSGETRTRTGDTTIFSRVELALSLANLQGFSLLSSDLAVSAFSRTLRSFAL